MNRRRRLTLAMIRRLEAGTAIPASVLIQPYRLATGVSSIEVSAAAVSALHLLSTHNGDCSGHLLESCTGITRCS